MTIEISQPKMLSETIKFGSFDLILLIPIEKIMRNAQESGGNALSQIIPNQNDEGWILVIHQKGRKKNPLKLAKILARLKVVR